MKQYLLAVGILTLCSLFSVVAEAKPGARHFTGNDVFELEYADDPRLDAKARRIVYVRRSNDIMTDKTRSNLWQINVDGSGHRPLFSNRNNYTSPRWSPTSDRIAYLSSSEGNTQIYVRWMDTGQTALLTNVAKSPSSLSWSPDGKWLAFTMNVPGEKAKLAKQRNKPKGAQWSEPVRIIDTVRYQFDGRGIVEPEYKHIFIIPADGGTPRQLSSGNFNHNGPLSWSNTGNEILFSANRHKDWELETTESDIFAIDVRTGNLNQLTKESGTERNPRYSPNGKKIAFIKAENNALSYRTSYLAVMGSNGTKQKVLSTKLDSSVSNLHWAKDNRSIYFQYDERAVRKVGRMTLKSAMKTVASNIGGTSLGRPYLSGKYHVAGNGVVVFTHGLEDRPSDIAVTMKGKTKTLTDLNDDLLANMKLGKVHEINYKSSFDNQQIQGWYVTPPNFDATKSYPLILEIHGGPHLAYGPYFSAEMQLLAAAGYVVFYDNHRGSTSYGEKFAMLLHYKYSSKEDFADHMSGVDAMIGKGFIDKDNLFIAGGSAGGIATAYAVGLTDRFNAAVAAKPVINWISKTLTADSSVGQIHNQFPGFPWDNLEHYWQRSPLSLVGNVKTPTMLITGEADRRTPISETEQFYQALKLLQVDTVMLRVPGSPHGIAGRPSRLLAKVDSIIAWFKRYRTDLND